jgi:hypothetical protein
MSAAVGRSLVTAHSPGQTAAGARELPTVSDSLAVQDVVDNVEMCGSPSVTSRLRGDQIEIDPTTESKTRLSTGLERHRNSVAPPLVKRKCDCDSNAVGSKITVVCCAISIVYAALKSADTLRAPMLSQHRLHATRELTRQSEREYPKATCSLP